MVILGIGTNIGDRLFHLREALAFLKAIPELTVQQVSPVYLSDALLPPNAPSTWNIAYLNLALRCETTLTPEVLLQRIKIIEKKLGRKPGERWGPRIIDIDILAWDDWVQQDETLHIPHKNLHERPFALWPLADVAPFWIYPLLGKTATEIAAPWGSRFSGNAPLHTRQIPHRIDTPQLMGILNVTPDSFSDGGKYSHIDLAMTRAKQLINSGANILDIGAESTGPHAQPITPQEEWQRLEPVLNTLFSEITSLNILPKISVDTRHAITAKKALDLGVHWINDVSGLQNPAMQEVIAHHACDVVLMHHLSIPEDRTQSLPLTEDPVQTVYHWALQQLTALEKKHITPERLILDVGIGYGKTAEQSLALLKNISVFTSLGLRLLVGHSRKSFLQQWTLLPPEERDLETVILSTQLIDQSVDFLRIHDVELHTRAFKALFALKP